MKKVYLCLLSLLMVYFCSCSTDVVIQKVMGKSSEGPVFMGYKALESGFGFEFSRPVKVLSITFSPHEEVTGIEDNANFIQVETQHTLKEGSKVVADLVVEDDEGNTLNVLIPLRTRNSRMPRLLINEIRTEYSNPKAEFVEFKVLGAGNIGALRVFVSGIGNDEPMYEFPAAEVNAGEYVVLHLRTLDPASVDETGDKLEISPGAEALPGARDFWVPGSVKLIRKTDVIYIKDQDDVILDAVMMSETQDPWWQKEHFAQTAKMLGDAGAWLPAQGTAGKLPGPADAAASQYATLTRTICRNETAADSNTAADWYIAATSNATPGAANSSKRYEP